MSAARATYRLQLRAGTRLPDAARLLPYLERLGVSHLYPSPLFRACTDSAHGYDVVDPAQVDPALGGLPALERLAERLRAHGLQLLLDIVPNHMALSDENPYLDEVLAHGRASRFARWFDVDWEHGHGIALPVLGRSLSETLRAGELSLRPGWGGLRVVYHDRSWPVDPATLPQVLERATRALRASGARGGRARLAALCARLADLPPRDDPDVTRRIARVDRAEAIVSELRDALAASRDLRSAVEGAAGRFAEGARGVRRMRRLLAAQAYRLGYWKTTRQHLNYRRFFEIDGLVALRQEDPGVFAATHAGLLALAARGLVDAVRVDHVDGLRDPRRYLADLRTAVVAALPAAQRGGFFVLVEKILAADEALRADWPVDGTTGYEWLVRLDDCLLDPQGAATLERAWRRDVAALDDFAATARKAKRFVLETRLRPDLVRVARAAWGLLPARGRVDPGAVRDALAALIAELDVYRTYVAGDGPFDASDERRVRVALRAAARHRPALAEPLRQLRGLLLPRADRRGRVAPRVAWIRSLEQLSGPAAAKGIEDTAFYRHTALLSRCEVGGEPGAPLGDALPAFHRLCRARAERGQRSLCAASTHDTKHSADVRARLAVLSEIPEHWTDCLARWRAAHAALRLRTRARQAPDAAREHAIYQTILALWPMTVGPRPRPRARAARAERVPSAATLRGLAERVEQAVLKGGREAKQQTSWIDPDARVEQAVRRFVRGIFDPRASPGGAAFLPEMAALAARVSRPGLWKSLSRCVVQLAAPGVPDIYQGDELWRFSLVDPDNRRPVDFALRRRLLQQVERGFAAPARQRGAFLRALRSAPEDGRVKLHVLRSGLHARARHPELFCDGAYAPVRARGRHARRLIAFARAHGSRVALVVAPRLVVGLGASGEAPVGPATWGDTRLVLPRDLAGRRLESALTGETLEVERPERRAPQAAVSDLLATLPVGLWIA